MSDSKGLRELYPKVRTGQVVEDTPLPDTIPPTL